ncbi:ABC transporter ATP-binding protein [Streptomyces sp. TRM76323]|uniref:ABC transporter ATP-binding protein n=1 Tax=Streptomyces tamarix TaxID=3078565 RepID=A0ABU3QQG6_9ACTN|nr:ABC transporter ATP-binding protein [Streptomyces tamarix]MDT9685013.1 ABC transporter ATP-binding protein [Streptomyces tamarix]
MTDSYADPGTPDHRSAARYLWWLTISQRQRVAGGTVIGTLWMVCLLLPPYLMQRAVDDGLQSGKTGTLVGWVAALVGAALLNAWLGIMRHRIMTRVRMDATFRTIKVVVAHSARLGAELPRRVSTGEVASIGVGDVAQMSQTLTITGPGVGAVVAYLVAAALLLSISVPLALVVLLGVPLLVVVVGPLLERLQGAESKYREQQGALTARLGDIVGGMRVLNGIGGKEMMASRYLRGSQDLQGEGYRVGAVTSWIQALSVGLPALFLALVTWLAARMAAEGTITIGTLVAVYGYVAVLVVPVSNFIEGGYDLTRGLVAARRVIRVLALKPTVEDAATLRPAPGEPSTLRDADSGVELAPGRMTAIVSARPADSAAVVDRLGRYSASAATWGGVPLAEVALAEVRSRIVVADNDADFFSGPLRSVVGGRSEHTGPSIAQAFKDAAAEEIVQAMPDGLDTPIQAQGSNLSGGQRQRLRLVRALLADPEVLLLVEPTSAVDAHTEAAMAAGLRRARTGRTTALTSTSPVLLEQADTVAYLVDGRLAAAGPHRELLASEPGYRALVARGETDTESMSAEEAVR